MDEDQPSRPLVEIVVCTYNGENYIKKQLDSLTSQTYPYLHITIIDDCSSDSTFSILSEYAQASKVTIIQNDQNLGVNRNFEKGIALSNADFIALCDQDDVWHAEKIERLVNSIGNSLLIYHDSSIIDSGGKRINMRMSKKFNFVRGKCNRSLILKNCVSGHAMMFRNELRKVLIPAPDGMVYDWWIAYAAASLGSIDYTKEVLVDYRQHSANSSESNLFRVMKKKKSEMNFYQKVQEKRLKYQVYIRAFLNYPFQDDNDKRLLQTMFDLYKEREQLNFSFRLVWFLLKHMRSLFAVQRTWFPEKLLMVLKEGFKATIKAKFEIGKNKIGMS